MILGVILIFSFGFFLLYNTSKKIKLGNSTFEKYLQCHVTISKWTGTVILLLSTYWFVYEFGLGIGIFYALVIFMTIISLMVILLPLQK